MDKQIKVAFKWEFVYDEKLVRQGPTFDSSCNELNQQKTEQKEMALRWQKSFWFPPPWPRISISSGSTWFHPLLLKTIIEGEQKQILQLPIEPTTRRREAKKNAKSKIERVEYGIGLWSCRLAFRHMHLHLHIWLSCLSPWKVQTRTERRRKNIWSARYKVQY